MGEVIYLTPPLEGIMQAVQGKPLRLPFFNGTVPAGFPSPAEDYQEEKLDLNELVMAHPAATYFVRVKGDSMVNAGILDGALVVVDRSLEITNGSVVVAAIDGEPTVKRFIKDGRQCYLQPANPKYKTIVLEEGSELMIWGVVSYIVQKPTME